MEIILKPKYKIGDIVEYYIWENKDDERAKKYKWRVSKILDVSYSYYDNCVRASCFLIRCDKVHEVDVNDIKSLRHALSMRWATKVTFEGGKVRERKKRFSFTWRNWKTKKNNVFALYF